MESNAKPTLFIRKGKRNGMEKCKFHGAKYNISQKSPVSGADGAVLKVCQQLPASFTPPPKVYMPKKGTKHQTALKVCDGDDGVCGSEFAVGCVRASGRWNKEAGVCRQVSE